MSHNDIDFRSLAARLVSEYRYPAQPKGLYEPIEYCLDCGGKRLRPQLLLATCRALGGSVATAESAALGIEMFHNFTLLHDDVMDRADVRRGRPTVHVKWDDVTAILSGDAMLTLATELIANVPDRHLRAVLNMFNRTAMEVYEGQRYDMDFETRTDVTVDEYMDMIRLKTSVLLGGACAIGAMLADAPEADVRAMYDFAVDLGLAFQLRDDYLDTFGDAATFGKEIGGDILNRKQTWLLINARRESDGQVDALYDRLNDQPEQLVSEVTALYRKLRLPERCDALVAEYADRAIARLDAVQMPAEARQWFVSLTKGLSSRTC